MTKKSIDSRIEKLEEQSNTPRFSEELVSLLSRITGFRERYGLGSNPSEEQVEEAISRMSSHAVQGGQR